MGKIFDAQGRYYVHRSGLKSNSSEILCLSSLSASLKKIRSKLKALSCPQHFFRRSRVGNSEVNGWMWPEFELFYVYSMITCKFDDDTIKPEAQGPQRSPEWTAIKALFNILDSVAMATNQNVEFVQFFLCLVEDCSTNFYKNFLSNYLQWDSNKDLLSLFSL